jgi:hypothetical protein
LEKQAPSSLVEAGFFLFSFILFTWVFKQIRLHDVLYANKAEFKAYNFKLNHIVMKDQDLRQGQKQQGSPTSDRAHHEVKNDKKQNGITNGGGQRSDQTSNKDNQRKRGE